MMAELLQDLDVLRPLLAVERLGLLTDVDGTISAIALRPEAAVVSPVAREALATLSHRLVVTGAISGRALFDLRAMLDLPDLLYIGSHGLTWWWQGQDDLPEDVLPFVAHAKDAARALTGLKEIPGLEFEDKGVGLALHYRLTADPDAARAAIVAAVEQSPAARPFELRRGIMVLELYPRLPVHKGTAVRRVVERFDLDGLIFLGDDLTDLDAIVAATELRAAGRLQTATIAVRHAESPPQPALAADYVVDGIAGAEHVLDWLAREAPVPATPVTMPRSE
jgi:trehalose 6-phosphate phosphatase